MPATPVHPDQLMLWRTFPPEARLFPLDLVVPCAGCVRNKRYGYGPAHNASPRCRSGGRPHCTCDTCF